MSFFLRRVSMSFNSHRAREEGKWAEANGKADAFHNAVFRAYFEDGRNLHEIETLAAEAEAVGLNGGEMAEILFRKTFKAKVDQDWQGSHHLGITAVPTLRLIGENLVGAQPYEQLAAFLKSVSGRLANNLEVAHNGINGLGVRTKALIIQVSCVLENPVDRSQNILYSEIPSSMRHERLLSECPPGALYARRRESPSPLRNPGYCSTPGAAHELKQPDMGIGFVFHLEMFCPSGADRKENWIGKDCFWQGDGLISSAPPLPNRSKKLIVIKGNQPIR
jgi:hypothetical protein